MASSILTRSFGGVQDNRALMPSTSNFVRPITITTWNSIRVCLRASITDPGAGLKPYPQFAIGLCSGSTDLFVHATTKHFVGYFTNNGGLTNITKQVGPPYYIVPRWFPGKKIGATRTMILDPTDIYCDIRLAQVDDGLGANPYQTLMMVDITRPGGATAPTSGAYRLCSFYRSTNPTYAATFADFQTKAIDPTPDVPPMTNHKWGEHRADYTPVSALLIPITLAVDEITNGTLDHISVSWQVSPFSVEISDVGFVRLL